MTNLAAVTDKLTTSYCTIAVVLTRISDFLTVSYQADSDRQTAFLQYQTHWPVRLQDEVILITLDWVQWLQWLQAGSHSSECDHVNDTYLDVRDLLQVDFMAGRLCQFSFGGAAVQRVIVTPVVTRVTTHSSLWESVNMADETQKM